VHLSSDQKLLLLFVGSEAFVFSKCHSPQTLQLLDAQAFRNLADLFAELQQLLLVN
jgi:hypothetical protein